MNYPPFILTTRSLYWLWYMVDAHQDVHALSMLHWQASISSGGINEGVK